jgi:hypothetical protein
MYPEAFGAAPANKAESGFMPALKAGYEELKGSTAALAGRVGITDIDAAEKYRAEQQAKARGIFKPTEEWGLTKGLELLGGSLPYMAAPLAAGAVAPAGLPTLGAAGLASLAQFTGTNIGRQMDEGTGLRETSLGAAAAGAVPQAALDLIPMARYIPGVRQIFGYAGKKISADAAEELVKQGTAKVMADYAKATGKAMGAEGATEAAQQFIERLQAGLNLTDEQARDEYWQSLVGGAVLGGALAPAGRAIERGQIKRTQQQEAEQTARKQAFEERKAAKLAEEERLKSPDYALEVQQKYEEAEAQRKALVAQKIKVEKGSDTETADRAFNKDIDMQLRELSKTLKPLATEQARLRPVIKQAQEAKRREEMSPMEYMLEQTGEVPAATPVEPGTMPTPVEPEEVKVPEALQFAKAQIEAAKYNELEPGPDAYTEYLIKRPDYARKLVDTVTGLPGLSPKESRTVLSRLRSVLDLQEREATRMGEAGTAAMQQRLSTVEAEEQAALEASREAERQAALDAQAQQTEVLREQRIAPEVEGIRRLGKVPEDSFSAANAEAARERMAQRRRDEELAGQLVETLPLGEKRMAPGRIETGRAGPKGNRKELLTQLAIARITDNRDAAQEAIAGLRDLSAADEVTGRGRVDEETLQALGAGRKPPSMQSEAQAEKYVDEQNLIFTGLVRQLENRRRMAGKLSTPGTFQQDVRDAKEKYAAAHIAELEARRESLGLPKMADWEKGESRARVMEALNELENRWGQIKGRKAEAGQRTFGAPMEAVKVLQQQMRDNVNATINNAITRDMTRQTEEISTKTGAPKDTYYYQDAQGNVVEGKKLEIERKRGPQLTADEIKLRGEPRRAADEKTDALRLIEQVLTNVERRTRAVPVTTAKPTAKVTSLEEIAKLYEVEKTGGLSEKTDPATVELLQQLREALPASTDPEFAKLSREVAQRVMEGNLPNANDVRDLNEMMQAQRDAGQSVTRPGATPEELRRTSAQQQGALFPEAEVMVQRATPANFQRLLDSKDVQGMRRAIAEMRAENTAVLQQLKKYVPDMQKSMKAAIEGLNKARAQVAKAKEIAQADLMEPAWYAPAVRDVVEYETALQSLPLGIKRLKEIQPKLVGKALKENKQEIKRLQDGLKEAQNRVDGARKKLDSLMTQYQKDVVLRQATQNAAKRAVKAEKAAAEKLASLRQQAAQVEESLPLDSTEKALKEATQAAREGMGLPGRRLVKDTTEMKRRAAQIRSGMGGLEKALDKAKKANKTEDVERLQNRLNELENQLDSLYETSPVVETKLKEDGEALLDQAFEDAQIALAAKQRAELGIPTQTLAGRRVGPVVKNVRSGLKSQAGERKSLSSAADAATDALVAARAERTELERRENYLKDNGKKIPGDLKQKLKDVDARIKDATKLVNQLATEERAARKLVTAEGQKAVAAEIKRADETGSVPNIGTDATETTSAQQDPLTAEAKEALEDGRILDVLTDIANNSKVPFIRENAEKLLKFVSRTRIGLAPDITVNGAAVPAAFNSEVNAIGVRPGYETEANVVHEATHAATMRALEGPESSLNADQLAAKQEIIEIFEALKAKGVLEGEYAAKNVKEFASEVQSNAALRKKLDTQTLFGSTALRRFFNAVMRLIGMRPKYVNSAEAQAVIERLYMQSGKLAAPAAPAGQAKAPGFENALDVASEVISQPKTIRERIEANLGLAFRTQFLDRLAPLEKIATEYMDSFKGTQMMYYLRMMDQKMSFVQQAVGRGVPQLKAIERPDGETEYVFQSEDGPNLAKVVETLKKTPGMNAAAANQLFTLYLGAKRADRVGYNALNFGVSEDKLRSAVADIEANDEVRAVFEQARDEYNEYNRDLMKFMEQTGALKPEEAKRLAETNDYIPYYREENGNAVLVIGGEGTYKVGNLKDQPQLKQLIGGEEKILDFLTSSVQNTSMLMDMGLRNQATKNAMFELVNLGFAKILRGETSGDDIVRFKEKGVDKYVAIDAAASGIPAELLVKGMEGIPVNNSALVQAMAMPATLLRRAITLSPLYAARQLFRDSVAAPLLSGADFTPVMGALKQLGKSDTREKLESRGIVGGQVFTGTNEDLSRILSELQSGKIGVGQLIARAEAVAMEADALTRRAQYDSYIAQGLSDMEATLMSLESMNFNRRGLSPSMRLASQLIPFFNAQVQSLDVLYRAMSGKMPMNERLDIQGKLYRRGALLAGTAVAYAMMMRDDEAYKNAYPDEKYGNFFVRLPGLDEPVRIPVPFEIGYIFKALPEAIVNSMASEEGATEAYKAFKNIAIQTVPGGTSLFLPAAIKPIVENVTNYSFYSGRGIESKAEEMRLPEYRFRDNTSELAKSIGQLTGTSPLKIENLIRGYTGSMGTALAQSLNFAMPTEGTPEKAAKRLSDAAVIGPLFQPNDAGGIIGATYDRVAEIQQVQKTYNEMLQQGRAAEARAFMQERSEELAKAAIAGNVQQQLGSITKAMNAIKASNMPPDEKREQLDRMQKLRIEIAKNARGLL